MNTLMLTILVPIIIGALASFIVWYMPTERFLPKDKIVCYNQRKEDDNRIDSNCSTIVRTLLKRNVHIVNKSSKFAAYNITCFFEFIDDESNIVYHEEKQQAYMAANTTEVHPLIIPFKGIPISKIEQLKPNKIRLFLIYENRYGTKKVSGPWWIKGYDLDRTTFEPELGD